MSWKASGYVKELRDGLTVTEKFVLLILAEYHHTDEKLAWPSVATLAADCLMTERGVRQIISRLIENGFLVRSTTGGGRGNIAGYRIVGVDPKGEPETLNGCAGNTQTPHSYAEKGERNPAQPTYANKEEPVFELEEPVNPRGISEKDSKKTKPKTTMPTVPKWLPLSVWERWLAYRTEKKASVTPMTAEANIKLLAGFRLQGMSPEDVIEQSIAAGWRGLFALKTNGAVVTTKPSDSGTLTPERLQALIGKPVDRSKEEPYRKGQPAKCQ